VRRFSVNEGKFPAGKSQNSFLPYDVKRNWGYLLLRKKDAIYTYHFTICYNVPKYLFALIPKDGLDAGEK
jgi:hypothetical protein